MADCFLGEVQMFAGMYAPRDWAFCDGQLLNISEYGALFNLIGTTYGGDGVRTFALPDLRGRLVLHAGGTSGEQYALGQKGGQTDVTLTPENLPPHTHPVRATAANGAQPSPANGLPAVGQSYATNATATMAAGAVASSGNGYPFSVEQPYVAVSYIIALWGTYPSRP